MKSAVGLGSDILAIGSLTGLRAHQAPPPVKPAPAQLAQPRPKGGDRLSQRLLA